MNSLLELWNRARAMFRKSEWDRDIDEELAAHIDLLAEDNRRRGMNAADAVRAARVAVGNLELNKEVHRDSRGLPMIDTLMQDLRYTFRTLRRDLGFAMFAILIVGLGIGASATVFSVVNALLLRPLPFKNPAELAWVTNWCNDCGMSGQTTQVDHVLDLRKMAKSFSEIGGYDAFYGNGDFKLTGTGDPERLSGVSVTQNFFNVLGIAPELGRGFTDEESKFNGARAVILSHPFWQRRFDADPQVIGRKIILNDVPVTVVGVMPESFDFGAIFAPGRHFELLAPFPLSPETNRQGNTMALVARLSPGATIQSAQAELTILGKQLTAAHRRDRNDFGGFVSPLVEHVSGRVKPALVVLACAVGVVMLIVCANLSSLLLGRTVSRQKEIAIRAAMGAGRGRLVRQMLTESLVLSFAGAVLGLILALLGTRGIAHIHSLSIPLLQEIHVDARAFGFILFAAVITGLAFGVLPALNLNSVALHDSLKDAGRGSSQGKGHAWTRKALVAAEVAFACMLLVGTGLLVRSLFRVLDADLGFHPESAASVRIDPDSRYRTQAQQNGYFNEALRLVREIPGVTSAGLTDALPFEMNRSWGAPAVGVQYEQGKFPLAFPHIVSDGYFRALGVPLREGREFTPLDTQEAEHTIIINESLAHRLWPGEDAIGKQMRAGGNEPRRVVGIVGDVRHLALEEASGNEMYLPIRQTQDYSSVDLVVRSTLPLAELATRVRAALQPIEPNLPSAEFRTVQTVVDLAVSPRRFLVLLLAGFAGFALILASLGIYAVISYSVTQRTPEIGIRMALGASAGDLQRGILGETLTLAGIGMAVGIAGGWLVSRSLQTLLYGVTPSDPVTFAAAFAVLLLVAITAGYLPARRVSKIDPTLALRAG
ncbi:MAG TPA: ABC transporter permease [Bryobacteraceae bacterium]